MGLLGAASCLKPSDSDIQTSLPKPYSGTVIQEVLAQQPELALYHQAYKRLGIDREMEHNKGYTIFAVKDAGMIAAGDVGAADKRHDIGVGVQSFAYVAVQVDNAHQVLVS